MFVKHIKFLRERKMGRVWPRLWAGPGWRCAGAEPNGGQRLKTYLSSGKEIGSQVCGQQSGEENFNNVDEKGEAPGSAVMKNWKDSV